MTGELQDLTQVTDGQYTYCRRGLTAEFFPDTFFEDCGGASGWVPFSEGTLTNRRSDFVIWDGRSVAGSGVDVLFDLGADCWLDEVHVQHVRLKGYGCRLGGASVSVRADRESRYRRVTPNPSSCDRHGITGPWFCLIGLNAPARFVRLHLEPSGQSLYADSSIGLVSVQLLGLPLEEKVALESRPQPYPWPAQISWAEGFFTLEPRVAIIAPEAGRFPAEWFRQELMARFGLALRKSSEGPGIRLVHTSWSEAERYDLRVQPDGLVVEGDAAGLFYGVLTLLQLIENRGGQLRVPAVSISDKPLAAIRGLHVYLPSREDIPYFKRLLDVMASLKLNTVVMEVGAGMRYRSHPSINTAWEAFARTIQGHLEMGRSALLGDPVHPRRWQDSMHTELAGGAFLEQEEVRDLVNYARRRHIAVIPEVQTLSHCYWILCAFPELSERDDTPYPDTYCPSNPDVYPLVFDLLDEVAEVFEPQAVHIGHDEAWAVGTCPKCKGRLPAKLFEEDISRLHDHLATRNIQTWMWADTLDPNFLGWSWTRKDLGVFLQSPDTCGLVDAVPKDILAVNWHWGHTWSREDDPQILERLIHRAGLKQVYGNFEGAFCEDFARRSDAAGIRGAILPSWVANAEDEMGRNGVIHNLLFSANVLWSCRYQGRRQETIQEVVARVPRVRSHLSVTPSPMLSAEIGLLPIDVTEYANAPLADPAGALGEYDLRDIPTGELVLGGTPFWVSDPARNGGHAVICAQGPAVLDRLYPTEVTGITIQRRAASLIFLHVASNTADSVLDWQRADNPIFMGRPREARQTIARYQINYQDGTRASADLRYDEHLTRWNTRFGERSIMPYRADPVWQGNTRGDVPVTLWAFEWLNPHPDRMIQTIDLVAADNTDAAVLLLAITVVETKEGTTS